MTQSRPGPETVKLRRKFLAEALGTGLLVFFGVGVATITFGFHFDGISPSAGVVATALTFGLVLLALAYALGPVSGCHVNPAVTLGVLLTGRIRLSEAIGYWIAQFAGGILGALLLWGVLDRSPFYQKSMTGLGANGWGSASLIHISMGGAFLAEVILTGVFVFVILAVTGKLGNSVTAGLVIGLSLTLVHLIGIPITGTSVNPARSLGPALILGGTPLNQVWLFIVAPLVGGIVAAAVHYVIFAESGAPAAAAPGASSGTSDIPAAAALSGNVTTVVNARSGGVDWIGAAGFCTFSRSTTSGCCRRCTGRRSAACRWRSRSAGRSGTACRRAPSARTGPPDREPGTSRSGRPSASRCTG